MPGGYDFGRADYYDGIGAVGFAYGAAKPADIGAPPLGIVLRKPLADLRETIRRRIIAVLPGDTGEIAAALVMGDQRGISEATQEAMRASGLGHVLSISGLHMALVAGSTFWLIRALLALSPGLALTRPIKKWAAAGALAVATFYLAISGANVATQRAYIMLAVILCAVMLDRRAITLRNVAIAAILVLLIEPESLLTASFQMSFAATLALVAGYEALRERAARKAALATAADRGPVARLWRAAYGLFLTSLIAALATTPFAIYHFQRAAPLALLANLAAMPVIGVLVMPAALFSVVLMPFGLEFARPRPDGLGHRLDGRGRRGHGRLVGRVGRDPGRAGERTASGRRGLPVAGAVGGTLAPCRSRADARGDPGGAQCAAAGHPDRRRRTDRSGPRRRRPLQHRQPQGGPLRGRILAPRRCRSALAR